MQAKYIAVLAALLQIVSVFSQNAVLNLNSYGETVAVQNAWALQNPTEITIEAWIYPILPANAPSDGIFFYKSDGSTVYSDRSYELRWYYDHARTGPGSQAEVDLFLGTETWVCIGGPAPAYQWTHIAVTYQSQSSTVALYINGQLYRTTTTDAAGVPLAGKRLRQTSLPLVFGWYSTRIYAYTAGYLDEVRIWNRALQPCEISANKNQRLTNWDYSLVGYWNFDCGYVYDLTGHCGYGVGNVDVTSVTDCIHVIPSVPHVNASPIIVADANISLWANESHIISFSVTDAETSPSNLRVTVSCQQKNIFPDGCILYGGYIADKRQVVLWPVTAGSAILEIEAIDDQNAATKSYVALTVYNPTPEPIVEPIPIEPEPVTIPTNNLPASTKFNDITIAPGLSSLPIDFEVFDNETPAQDLFVTVVTSNPELIHVFRIIGSMDSGKKQLTLTASPDVTGTVMITVTVQDSDGNLGSEVFLVTVKEPEHVNTPPVIVADSSISLRANQPYILKFSVNDEETNPSDLHVTASCRQQSILPDDYILWGGHIADKRQIALWPISTGMAILEIEATDEQNAVAKSYVLLTVY